ncbi:hypothetical protein KA005_62625 [bacterium]|nr:hypothetical protein [bacterium]
MKQYLYIAFGCFVIAVWTFSILLLGCVPHFNPCPDYLKTIEDRPYIVSTYTCLHKSKDAFKCLRKHGYDARVVCGPVEGLERHHCWVEIKHEGEIYWYDPTWIGQDARCGCWKASLWTDREIFRPEWNGKIKHSVKGE